MSDPGLAEGRWLWRRLYVFAASAGLWWLLGRAIGRMASEDLPRVVEGLIALMQVLYLVAPTAQQMIAMLANLRLRMATGGRA